MKKVIFTLVLGSLLALKGFAQTSTPTPATTTPTTATPPVNAQPQQAAAPAPDPNAGDFSFTEETFDFGTVPRGTPVSHEFNFTNTGKEPIVISNVQASCGCTTPSWPKEPILPGKTSVIKVQYNAANPGGFNKSVTITSNAKAPTKVLYIKGTVQAQTDQTTPDKPQNILTTPNNN